MDKRVISGIKLAKLPYYVFLMAILGVVLFPFYFMVSLSLQSTQEVFSYPPRLIPGRPMLSNYIQVWTTMPFSRFMLNTTIVASSVTALHIFFDSLSGYVFAKFEFPGRRLIFNLLLLTLMIPIPSRIVPLYRICQWFGWVNTYQGLILPFMSSAFGILIMRQFIRPIPTAIIDAARIDGCSEFSIFLRIILPLCKPALAVIAVFTFIYQWNSFLWPVVIVDSELMRTLTMAITYFARDHWMMWNLAAASSVFLFLPTLILFSILQRFIVSGLKISLGK